MRLSIYTLLLFFIFPCSNIFAKSNTFNPDLGLNLLFLSQNSSRTKTDDGMKLQEAEIGFSSDVDTHFTSKATFSIAAENGVYAIEPEEAYVDTISIPYVTVRAGKSKMPIGKHNQYHTHAYPFINGPLMNVSILGEEGLNENAIGASAPIPFPWFSEFIVDLAQGDNANLFNSGKKDNKLVVGHFKNLWDISESATLELGLSGANGKNDNQMITHLYGADLTLKWRPVDGGKYHSFEWASEFLEKDKKGSSDGKLSGIVSHLKYQLSQRWYAQYRYDYLGLNKSKSVAASKRHTALFAFLPSEFSGIRFQYETIDDGQLEKEKRVSLQLNISIGAHPAHAY